MKTRGEGPTSVRRLLQPHFIILPALVVLLIGAGSAFAADNGATYRTIDDRDNIVDFDSNYSRDCAGPMRDRRPARVTHGGPLPPPTAMAA